MTFFFDYIYYRIKKKFYNKYSDGILAAILVSVIQLLTVSNVLVVISKLFYSRQDTSQYSKLIAQIGGAIFIILTVYNFKKYYSKYWLFWERWKDESDQVLVTKGWLVLISVLVPFLILILIGIFM